MARSWPNVRIGIRSLLRTPGSTAVAVTTLALGIGANTAIFSLVNALLLRPLPIPHPEQLVALSTTIADNINGDEPFTLQIFEELGRRQQIFSELFAWNGGSIKTFEADGNRFAAGLAEVSGNYYQAIGVAPLLGRFIQSSDVALENGTSNAVAVISYRAWRSWYHGEANVIGETIRMGNQPFTIIGVEPEGYSGLIIDGATDVTVPIFAPGQLASRDAKILWLRLYGRLKQDVNVHTARASLATLWPHIQQATLPPGYEGERHARFFARRIAVESASTGISSLRKRFSYSLQVLLALVGAVLLIACLNLANLALARAASRQHEAGVRVALGATAWDLMRQPLIESSLLSTAGALLGLFLASWASRVLLHIAWTGLLITPLSTTPDARVLAFTATVTVLTALLFAIAPAWHSVRIHPLEALQRRTRSVRGGSSSLGKSLLVLQIALSLVLVVGALLFAQTLSRLHTVDVGYRRDHLLTLMLFPQRRALAEKDAPAYYQDLTEKIKRLPGVESVSFSTNGPANEFETFGPAYGAQNGTPVQAVEEYVGPNFFHTAGMRVLSGREFIWQDHEPAPVIISQSLAERLFGHSGPVGRTLYTGPHTYLRESRVVGVVNSASLWKVETIHPMAVYRPFWLDYHAVQPIMDIRTTADPRSLKASVEQAVTSLGHQYSLRIMTVEERLDSYLTVQRLMAMLSLFFGAIAVLIASIGLYGLLSFHVAQRTSELGVRVALGAQRAQVLSMVLREVAVLASLGCAIGFAATLAVSRFVRSILFGVSTTDPIILTFAVLILAAVSLAAGWLPARRAASVDPIAALRAE